MVTGANGSGDDGSGSSNRPVTVSDLVRVLDGEVVCCEDQLGRRVKAFAASDLLSDVLAFEKHDYALLTGLTNAQIVRTADITGASCVVIVRNKQPQQAAVALAQSSSIPIILAHCNMFEACARLSRLAEPGHDAVPRTSDPSGT
jgi:predicted transcriptional regulator